MSFLGQLNATSRFYLFGRKHCTRTGYEQALLSYKKPDLLTLEMDLTDCVYMVTGANAGIGHEIAQFLAIRKATVFIVCRNSQKGEATRLSMIEASNNQKIHLIVADCSLENDVRRLWQEFVLKQSSSALRLDALICNAGALLNERTLTKEGVETTFAAHLLFGVYLLGTLALPVLKDTSRNLTSGVYSKPTVLNSKEVFGDCARLIVVSSGGMYNTKFPQWSLATSTGIDEYNGQFAYAYAKRGQVLLCERWAAENTDIKVVSCHPGWTDSEGVQAAYGEQKRYLEPLRSLWQGAEGIIYLAVAPAQCIESGAFYLDRSPQIKHMPGPLGFSSNFTQNSEAEVDDMMEQLKLWSSEETRPTALQLSKERMKLLPLCGCEQLLDVFAIAGDWFVLACIPTFAEKSAVDGIIHYEALVTPADASKAIGVRSSYRYHKSHDSETNSNIDWSVSFLNTNLTKWKMNPIVWSFVAPISFETVIISHGNLFISTSLQASDAYLVMAMPDRSALWILTRAAPSKHDDLKPIDEVYDLGPSSTIDQNNMNNNSHGFKFESLLLHKLVAELSDVGFDIHRILRCATTDHITPSH